MTKVEFNDILKDPENVEYFLGHCLPKSFYVLSLDSSEFAPDKRPSIDKYVELLGGLSLNKWSENNEDATSKSEL